MLGVVMRRNGTVDGGIGPGRVGSRGRGDEKRRKGSLEEAGEDEAIGERRLGLELDGGADMSLEPGASLGDEPAVGRFLTSAWCAFSGAPWASVGGRRRASAVWRLGEEPFSGTLAQTGLSRRAGTLPALGGLRWSGAERRQEGREGQYETTGPFCKFAFFIAAHVDLDQWNEPSFLLI